MCPISLVGRLNQRCRSSRIDEVLECGDFMIILHILHQNPPNITLGACDSSKNCNKLFSVSCETFVLNPLSGKILYTTAYRWLSLDSPPSLRTLWSSVIKSPNFSARSTASPERLLWGELVICSQADVAFSVLSGSVYNYCASSIKTRLLEYVPNLSRENCVRVQATLGPQDYLWNPLTKNGRSANGSFASFLSSSRDSCTSLLGASSSHHSNTESEDELDAALFPETKCASSSNDSCGSVAEDELFPELTDEPGTTRGTKLSVLQKIRFPFLGQSWLLTADPLVRASVLNRNQILALLVSLKW